MADRLAERPCRLAHDDNGKPIKDDDGNRIRILNNRHLRDCNASGCPGCQPCTERHCQVCRHEHVTADGRGTDQTCARCLGTVRTRIGTIWHHSARMLGEAIRRGINATATNLAGPVANPEVWGYRRASVLAGRVDPSWITGQGKKLADTDDPHPLWVLATWEYQVRDHLGQMLSPGSSMPTLTEARDYLEHHLTWLAHDPEFDFAGMARDLADCQSGIERVLGLDEHVDLGPPCYVCGHDAIEKDYGTDSDDPVMWHCPKCDNWWNPDDYTDRTTEILVEFAEELTLTDMATRTRVPAGTLRRWAYGERRKVRGKVVHKPPIIEPSGRTKTGTRLYRVTDILALRDRGADRDVS